MLFQLGQAAIVRFPRDNNVKVVMVFSGKEISRGDCFHTTILLFANGAGYQSHLKQGGGEILAFSSNAAL